jgi:L-threonylcarbamoyladenylate synthase
MRSETLYNRELLTAARVVRRGGIVAYATEYCFGLGCDPFNRDAVLRLMRIKRRALHKGLIVLAANVGQLATLVRTVPAAVLATWPGPNTWLLEPTGNVPRWLTGRHPRLAVRVSAHPQAATLARAAGMAIVSTSANRAGQKPARTDREVRRRFGHAIDYVLPGHVGSALAPTPIRDALTGELVRPG